MRTDSNTAEVRNVAKVFSTLPFQKFVSRHRSHQGHPLSIRAARRHTIDASWQSRHAYSTPIQSLDAVGGVRYNRGNYEPVSAPGSTKWEMSDKSHLAG
ncbi:MAG: hypothetical protein EXS05_07945 [Planctomycetaceae bacterium]|nr:hypothetical protein [Planctomycetaceae bacterium]